MRGRARRWLRRLNPAGRQLPGSFIRRPRHGCLKSCLFQQLNQNANAFIPKATAAHAPKTKHLSSVAHKGESRTDTHAHTRKTMFFLVSPLPFLPHPRGTCDPRPGAGKFPLRQGKTGFFCGGGGLNHRTLQLHVNPCNYTHVVDAASLVPSPHPVSLIHRAERKENNSESGEIPVVSRASLTDQLESG